MDVVFFLDAAADRDDDLGCCEIDSAGRLAKGRFGLLAHRRRVQHWRKSFHGGRTGLQMIRPKGSRLHGCKMRSRPARLNIGVQFALEQLPHKYRCTTFHAESHYVADQYLAKSS